MLKRGNPYYQGPQTDHFDGTRFFNPGGIAPLGFFDALKWQFGGGKVRWPNQRDSPFPPARPEARIEGSGLRVTMVGHATLLVQVAGLNILTDPVWSKRASPFTFAGPARVHPPGIAFEDLPKIDLVLVSHNHYDHLDLRTLKALHAAHAPHFIMPLGNDALIEGAVEDAQVTAMDWGDGIHLRDGVSLTCEPVHHWSARGVADRSMALWSAFVVKTPHGHIYHIGDTGFHDAINYKAAKAKYGGFRLALLPFGAYEPRWFMKGVHQNPEEAVEGMLACGAAHVAGHHWGTFRLTDEGIDTPVEALNAALDARGIARDRFRPMHPGEIFDVPLVPPQG